jgi:FtsP/CotA-like multicopper oxidase with cupredoxin domain
LLWPLILAGAGAARLTAPVLAQPGPVGGPDSAPGGPCAYQDIDVGRWGLAPLQNPPEIRSEQGRLTTTLQVSYTDPAQTSIAGCPVTLRSYNGALVGPTLRVQPGTVMDVLLDNRLPRETPDQVAQQYEQEASQAFIATRPHPYNTTNLHTHGLHVSPAGNSDNVLLAIPAQSRFPYEIRVPASHPAGSYWYHAHAHGSTAIQVGSSMAGALIVEDDERRLPPALREANRRERVMVFQTILYDTEGRVDDITAFFPDSQKSQQLCAEGKPGCTWGFSKRRTTINGQIVPVIRMRPGEVQRWRMIDGAFRESLELRLEGHALHEIAVDGIYLGRVDSWEPGQPIDLEPGYRSDVLVQASRTPGTYRLIDAPSAAGAGLRGVAEEERVLAHVVVEGEPLDMRLPTSAEMAPLNPFPGVNLQATADGIQNALFTISGAADPDDKRAYFQINRAAFNPQRVRTLQLGATEQWTLSTVGAPHVFHIHINPFQATRTDPAGQNEVVWKDTLLIPTGATLNVYTRYLDYIGQFVIHCHILDHEDLGMMEVVDVEGELPQGAAPPGAGSAQAAQVGPPGPAGHQGGHSHDHD